MRWPHDTLHVVGAELAAVDQEQQFVSVLLRRCLVNNEQAADLATEAELFFDLAFARLARALVGLDVAAGDVPPGLVGGLHEEDGTLFVEEQGSGRDPGSGPGRVITQFTTGHSPCAGNKLNRNHPG